MLKNEVGASERSLATKGGEEETQTTKGRRSGPTHSLLRAGSGSPNDGIGGKGTGEGKNGHFGGPQCEERSRGSPHRGKARGTQGGGRPGPDTARKWGKYIYAAEPSRGSRGRVKKRKEIGGPGDLKSRWAHMAEPKRTTPPALNRLWGGQRNPKAA